MVRHWAREIAAAAGDERRGAAPQAGDQRAPAPSPPALVFVIVLVTKFAQGAWIVVLAAPILFAAMKAIARHYARDRPTSSRRRLGGVALPGRIHAVVLVSNLLAPTLRALAFAQATDPATLRAVTVAADGRRPTRCPSEWQRARRPGAARGDRVAVPRDRAPAAALRAPAAARAPGRRDLDRHPRVRRRRTGGRTCCTTRPRCG